MKHNNSMAGYRLAGVVMRSVLLAVCTIAAAVTTQAQITTGHWYNGSLVYSASDAGGSKILMSATAEGEELEFMLLPDMTSGETGTYRVGKGPNDYEMEYDEGMTVKHVKKEGLDVLCFYNSQTNQLEKVMKNEWEEDAQKLNIDQWMAQLRGDYTKDDGTSFTIDSEKALIGGVYVPLEVVTFNGMVIGIVEIDEKNYEVVPTQRGLQLYETRFSDEEYMWKRTGRHFALTRVTRTSSRFDFAGYVLLNGYTLRRYDKALLRLMRNAILAHHGYRFQSQDLQDYFGSESWYHPADSNDDIHLSLVEELNVALIKYAESQTE